MIPKGVLNWDLESRREMEKKMDTTILFGFRLIITPPSFLLTHFPLNIYWYHLEGIFINRWRVILVEGIPNRGP